MPAALSAHWPLALIVAAVFVLLIAAQRVPIVRTVLNLAITFGMAALLVIVLSQREQFDPYLGRIAAALKLDNQSVVGDEVRIHMAPDGHFWARASVDGVKRRMLIDSGATVTALSVDTAQAAGLTVEQPLFPLVLRTANGTVNADTSKVGELQLGDITARGLPVVVSPAFGDSNVLGMNFLSKLKSWRVEGSTLILVPHHPQAQATG